MTPLITFCRLTLAEFDAAYSIVCEATHWLLDKGIQQWLKPYPAKLYRERHEKGHNYGLFVGDELAVVVSLIGGYASKPAEWREFLPESSVMWLATLASNPRFKGHNLGEVTLREAESYLLQQGHTQVWLDCFYGQGFLPNFYQTHGYQPVARKLLDSPHGPYDSVLMMKTLNLMQTGSNTP
jgi:GNAT superfamily N-acetyltransferase